LKEALDQLRAELNKKVQETRGLLQGLEAALKALDSISPKGSFTPAPIDPSIAHVLPTNRETIIRAPDGNPPQFIPPQPLPATVSSADVQHGTTPYLAAKANRLAKGKR
jgi:hypothetical protein